MSRRLFLTISTAAGLWGMFWLYTRAVAPLVQVVNVQTPRFHEPDPIRATQRPTTKNADDARQYLPHVDWAADANEQFRTPQGIFFSQKLEPSESQNAISLTPFAMIWFQNKQNADEQPVTMVAEKAILRFSGSFDLTDPNPGRVVGAVLQNAVRIDGPNGLSITGRQFFFQEASLRNWSDKSVSIWSDKSVKFAYGPHRGTADSGIQMELIPAKDPAPNAALHVAGIRRIRLRNHVSMDLVLDEKSKPTHVNIECDRGFEFELSSNVAKFEENVRVRRPTGSGQADGLQCQTLRLFFNESGPQSVSGQAAIAGISKKLTFSGLVAEGTTVVVTSDANDLKAVLAASSGKPVGQWSELTYDAQTKIAVLSGSESVKLTQSADDLECPRIRLVHDDGGKLSSVWCDGPGILRHRDDSNKLILSAEWQKELRKYPDTASPLEIIELEEHAVVHQPEQQTTIAAQLMKLWLEPNQEPQSGQFVPRSRDRRQQPRPKFLQAVDNVTMSSPQLQAQTKRLEVAFEFEPDAQPRAAPASRQPRAGDQASGGRDATVGRTEPPASLVSDTVQVRVVADANDDMQVASVAAAGKVRITQPAGPNQSARELVGDRVQLLNNGETDQVVHVHGTPAVVQDNSSRIEGPDIYLDRRQNRTWIDGAGNLSTPVDKDLNGRVLDGPTRMTVAWNDKMQFDGARADFFGNVHAALTGTRMHCNEMQVVLSRPISFTSNSAENHAAEIHSVVCKDEVDFDSYEYVNDELIEVRQAKLGTFSLDQTTGATEALGPGSVKVWRRGQGKRAGLTPTSLVKANQPLRSDSSNWEYILINFSGKAQGNVNERSTQFRDRVKIVYGPVERPLETIDPDDLPKDAAEMQCEALDVWQQASAASEDGDIQLLAKGNAKLEGRSFFARADEITFDEQKGLYTLRSLSREAAIWREKEPGVWSEGAFAKSMKFIPSRSFLDVDRATQFQGLQLQ